jgi:hypothetical protein
METGGPLLLSEPPSTGTTTETDQSSACPKPVLEDPFLSLGTPSGLLTKII